VVEAEEALENPEELTQLNFKSPVRRAKFLNNFHHAGASRGILNMTGGNSEEEREKERDGETRTNDSVCLAAPDVSRATSCSSSAVADQRCPDGVD